VGGRRWVVGECGEMASCFCFCFCFCFFCNCLSQYFTVCLLAQRLLETRKLNEKTSFVAFTCKIRNDGHSATMSKHESIHWCDGALGSTAMTILWPADTIGTHPAPGRGRKDGGQKYRLRQRGKMYVNSSERLVADAGKICVKNTGNAQLSGGCLCVLLQKNVVYLENTSDQI